MDENDEYTEVWLNDEEAALPPDEMLIVACQKELMHDFVTGKDKDALRKARMLEKSLNAKRNAHAEQTKTKNGRNKR